MTPNLSTRKDDHYLSLFISGITKQIVDTEARYNDAGDKIGEMITKDFRSVVRVFWPDGVHDLE